MRRFRFPCACLLLGQEPASMLIFHKFPTRQDAEGFSSAVASRFSLSAFLFESQEDSDVMALYDGKLTAPIVLVVRSPDETVESRVIDVAEEFSGEFAAA